MNFLEELKDFKSNVPTLVHHIDKDSQQAKTDQELLDSVKSPNRKNSQFLLWDFDDYKPKNSRDVIYEKSLTVVSLCGKVSFFTFQILLEDKV